jgi:hypothetical protein
MVVVLLASGAAMTVNLAAYLASGQYLLLCIGAVMLALEVWVVLEAVVAMRRPVAQPA